MPENNNEFLNSVKIDQFIKSNNEQMKQNLKGVFTDTFKTFMGNDKHQKKTNEKLVTLVDTTKTSFVDLNKSIDSLNKNLSKILLSQTNTIIKTSEAQSNKNKGIFAGLKEEQKELTKTMESYVGHQKKQDEPSLFRKADKPETDIMKFMDTDGAKKKGTGFLADLFKGLTGLKGLFAIGGLAGFLLTGDAKMLLGLAPTALPVLMKHLFIPMAIGASKLLTKGLVKGMGLAWTKGIKPLAPLLWKSVVKPLGAGIGKVVMGGISMGLKGLVVGLKALVGKAIIGPIAAFFGGFGLGKLIDKFLIKDGGAIDRGLSEATGFVGGIFSKDIRDHRRMERMERKQSEEEEFFEKYYGSPEGGGDRVTARTSQGRDAFGLSNKLFKRDGKKKRSKVLRSFDMTDNVLRAFDMNKRIKKGGGLEYGFSIPQSQDLFKKNLDFSKDHKSLYLFEPWNPDFLGLHPDMRENILGMADEYYRATGKPLQLNSGKRDGDGHSTHDYGWAADIQSDQLNLLENAGVLKKYGFHRPLLNWHKQKEPWHIEPYPGDDIYGKRNTINNEYRVGTLMNNKVKTPRHGTPERGGDRLNLPQKTIERKIQTNEKIKVQLSKEDLIFLADEFGKKLKENKEPKQQRVSVVGLESGRDM